MPMPMLPPCRRTIWRVIRFAIRNLFYLLVYRVNVWKENGSVPAVYGRSFRVSVKRRGPYIEIIAHERLGRAKPGMIRLVPCLYNHGVFVEWHNPDGSIGWRTHANYERFYRMGQRDNPKYHPEGAD